MVERRSAGDVVFNILNYLVLGILALICIYPFWYIIMASFSDPRIPNLGLLVAPKGFTLYNYQEVLKMEGLLPAAGVSVARTVVGTVLSVGAVTFLGYIFSKDNVPAKKLFYRYFIITMYVSGGLIPTFLVYKAYGLRNSFLVYVLPGIVSAYNMILVKTYIETSVPHSLEESAMLDGAGYMTVFFKIILPLSVPIIATIALFTAVGQWNSWMDNMIYTASNKSLTTLQYLLYQQLNKASALANAARSGSVNSMKDLMEQMTLTPNSVRMTITAIVTLPILLVYPFVQRYFMTGLMIGAVKG